MDKQSTKNGPIIQFAAFRQPKLQQIIAKHFDKRYQQKWMHWMQTTNEEGKTMRINGVIIHKMIPFATQRLSKCVNVNNIDIEIEAFHVSTEEIENLLIDDLLTDTISTEKSTRICPATPYINNGVIVGHDPAESTELSTSSILSVPMIVPPELSDLPPTSSVHPMPPYGPSHGSTFTLSQSRISPMNHNNTGNTLKEKIEQIRSENERFRDEISRMRAILRYNGYYEYQQQAPSQSHANNNNVYYNEQQQIQQPAPFQYYDGECPPNQQMQDIHELNYFEQQQSTPTPIVPVPSQCYFPPNLSDVSSGNSCNSIIADHLSIIDDIQVNDGWSIDTRLPRYGLEMNTTLGSYHCPH